MVRAVRGTAACRLRLAALDGREGHQGQPCRGRALGVQFPLHRRECRSRRDPPEGVPAILTHQDEFDAWLAAPMEEALTLQRPLPDGALQVVVRGEKEDAAA
ncbi:MAG: hypothetical protein K0S56_1032 [Microvirga sp.]|nr:hypothetical protein [Microvirga sp.]